MTGRACRAQPSARRTTGRGRGVRVRGLGIRCGLATGHGDTIDDLIFELEKQIKNTSNAFIDAQKEIERLRVWNNLVENKWMWIESALQFIAMARPLRGQTWEKHSKQIKDYAIKALEWKEPN